MPMPRHAFTTPIRLVSAALAVALAQAAHAVQPLVQHDVVLLQTGDVIEQRVEGGADAMSAYLKTLGAALTETMRVNPQQLPSAGFIAVAIRPGDQTHTWFDFKPALADKTMAALVQTVETTPTMPLKGGEIVFALRVSVWSDKPPASYAPAPQAWKDASRDMHPKPGIDALVDLLWPR